MCSSWFGSCRNRYIVNVEIITIYRFLVKRQFWVLVYVAVAGYCAFQSVSCLLAARFSPFLMYIGFVLRDETDIPIYRWCEASSQSLTVHRSPFIAHRSSLILRHRRQESLDRVG